MIRTAHRLCIPSVMRFTVQGVKPLKYHQSHEKTLCSWGILLRASKKYYGSRALFYVSEGAEGVPPQNVPLWHIDYFELQANEQGINFPLCKWQISICKDVLLSHTSKRRMTLHQRQPESALQTLLNNPYRPLVSPIYLPPHNLPTLHA